MPNPLDPTLIPKYKNQLVIPPIYEPTVVKDPGTCEAKSHNYYMIAFYEKHGNLSHFRVDKMESIEVLELSRHELPDKEIFNPAEYSKKVFNMFGGKEEKIKLQFENSLIGVVLDRFGKGVMIRKADENSFIINVDALISPTLLGWLFEFGKLVKILEPEDLIEKFRQQAEESLVQYEKH